MSTSLAERADALKLRLATTENDLVQAVVNFRKDWDKHRDALDKVVDAKFETIGYKLEEDRKQT